MRLWIAGQLFGLGMWLVGKSLDVGGADVAEAFVLSFRKFMRDPNVRRRWTGDPALSVARDAREELRRWHDEYAPNDCVALSEGQRCCVDTYLARDEARS